MEALDAGIGEQDIDAAEFLFGFRCRRPQRRQIALVDLDAEPAARRAAATSRPVSSRSSGVDGATPDRGSTTAQISMPTTSAPSPAKATAVARPMPRAAPVITATFPRRHPFDPDIILLPAALQIQNRMSTQLSA